jgi:HD superfamily phosphodiesterase
MSRLTTLKEKIDALYKAKNPARAEWADWLHENHVFLVAEKAGELADRFGANKELAMAAGMLHDVADAVMGRHDARHAEESERMARALLRECGFSEEEIQTVVDDAIVFHGCHQGNAPKSLEGKVMATADALVHLSTDFYEFAIQQMRQTKTNAEIGQWVFPKLERDFNNKVLFDDVREEARPDYETRKAFAEKELN